jgi:protein subunit release factor B
MISRSKWDALLRRMQALDLNDAALLEKFIIGSGRGGQKIQKTASCVYLKHHPTGIEIKCQKTRFREDNRYYARRRLCAKLDELINQERSETQQAREKIRRQKKRRTRRAKDKSENIKHAQKKAARKPPSLDS